MYIHTHIYLISIFTYSFKRGQADRQTDRQTGRHTDRCTVSVCVCVCLCACACVCVCVFVWVFVSACSCIGMAGDARQEKPLKKKSFALGFLVSPRHDISEFSCACGVILNLNQEPILSRRRCSFHKLFNLFSTRWALKRMKSFMWFYMTQHRRQPTVPN